jgi:hypothetical protein
MNAHHVETTVNMDGTLILRDLPFQPGKQVEVIILERAAPISSGEKDRYPLRGKPLQYQSPFDPVAEKEWIVQP